MSFPKYLLPRSPIYFNVVGIGINPDGIQHSQLESAFATEPSSYGSVWNSSSEACAAEVLLHPASCTRRSVLLVLFPNDTHWALVPRDVP